MTRLPDPRLRLLCAYYLFRRGLTTGLLNPDVQRMQEFKDAFYRRSWQHAAEAAGTRLVLLSDNILEIVHERRRLRVSASSTSLDDPVTVRLTGDKPAVHGLLKRNGIPVPPHLVIEAGEFENKPSKILSSLPLPLVVKPAVGTGSGAGVSTNITSLRQLRHGIAWAHAFGPRILIETQFEGDCYRVLLMDGEVLDTVMRRPPRVVGDGRSTVAELIARENRLRLEARTDRAQVLLRRDPDLDSTLACQGLTLRSRPTKGQAVKLKRVINDNRADENESVNSRLCGAILDTARRAAEVLGVRLAGVDVICTDPLLPLEQSGGVILEVNTTPGFYYHYHNVGATFPVAEHVLRRFFAKNACHGD